MTLITTWQPSNCIIAQYPGQPPASSTTKTVIHVTLIPKNKWQRSPAKTELWENRACHRPAPLKWAKVCITYCLVLLYSLFVNSKDYYLAIRFSAVTLHYISCILACYCEEHHCYQAQNIIRNLYELGQRWPAWGTNYVLSGHGFIVWWTSPKERMSS